MVIVVLFKIKKQLIDKTKAKNYDLVHIKNIFEKNNRKEAGLIFQGLKVDIIIIYKFI